jgi:murein DD-endopeptidase MepM/ murein hydrolase activator NlpD
MTTFRTITVTAVVTSAAWVMAGSWWLSRGHAAGTPPAAMGGGGARAAQAAVGRLVIPVAGVRREALVDTFTQARDGGARVHDAIDIMAPRGTPVIAAAAGRVEKLYLSKAGGNTIYLRSPDGALLFYYAHLDAYAPGLVEGRPVAAGETIGSVGSTGNADPAAPHLHFAVLQTSPHAKWYEPTTALNPYPLLMRR